MFQTLHISSKQWWLVGAISVFTVLATLIPVVYGTLHSGDNFYTGKTINSRQDLYTYLSWIEQGRSGNIFFKQLYSSEPQPKILFHPVFFGLGAFAEAVHINNLTAYHIGRVIAALAFLLITYLLISSFLESARDRLLAFLLVCTSSGFGFLLGAKDNALWIYEFSTFTDITNTILDPIGLALVLAVFLIALRFFSKRNIIALVVAVGLTNMLALIHPYDLMLLFGVLFAYSAWLFYDRKDTSTLLSCLYLLIGSFPGLIWQIWVLNDNPVLGVWAFIQSSVASASFLAMLVQYGMVLVLGLIGFWLIIIEKKKEYAFLAIWLGVGLLLIYSPLLSHFQRKFGVGYHVVLSICAAIAIGWVIDSLKWSSQRLKGLAMAVFVAIMAATNIYSTILLCKALVNDPGQYYLNKKKYDALVWLKANTDEGAVILSDYETSNIIPGLTGRTVFAGHYDQTISIDSKLDIAYFMLRGGGNLNDPLRKFVKQENINYIFIDEYTETGSEFNITNRPYLETVYANDNAHIYKVKSN